MSKKSKKKTSAKTTTEHDVRRNFAVAADEEANNKWVKDVDNLSDLKLYERLVLKEILKKHLTSQERSQIAFRLLQKGAPMVAAPVPFDADITCIYAVRENGEILDNDEIAVDKHFSQYGICIPIATGQQDLVTEGPELAFGVHPGIQKAILMRVPRLQEDQDDKESDKALNEQQHSETRVRQEDVQDASLRERTCSVCGIVKRKTMPVCSRCKKGRYCSATCQKQDWKTHKKVCQPVT
jgi:hypothetical protein